MLATTKVRRSFSLKVMLWNLLLASYSVASITHCVCPFVIKIDSCRKNCLVGLQLYLGGLCVPVLTHRALRRVQRARSRSAPTPFCCCPSLGHEGVPCLVRLSSLSRDTCPDGDLAVLPAQVWEHLLQLSMLTFPRFLICQSTKTSGKDIGKHLKCDTDLNLPAWEIHSSGSTLCPRGWQEGAGWKCRLAHCEGCFGVNWWGQAKTHVGTLRLQNK